jgi:hypothetical protein
MRVLAAACLTLAAEPLLGLGLHVAMARLFGRRGGGRGRRRRRLAWALSARDLARAAPVASLALVGALAIARAAGASVVVWPSAWAYLAAGALAGPGVWLLLRAGRREARGELRRARVEARLAGLLGFAGALARLVVVWSDLLFDVGFRRAVLAASDTAIPLVLGMLALGVAAFIAALAGLAGKPRPAAAFAAVTYVAAVAAFAAAAQAPQP